MILPKSFKELDKEIAGVKKGDGVVPILLFFLKRNEKDGV